MTNRRNGETHYQPVKNYPAVCPFDRKNALSSFFYEVPILRGLIFKIFSDVIGCLRISSLRLSDRLAEGS